MPETGTARRTNRWAGADAFAWAAAAVGLFAREPGILLLAAMSVVFLAYAKVGTPPDPDVALDREVDDETPAPGQEVTVRLTVENRGDRWLPDVRLVDGVPSALAVVDGSPHVGTVLGPGDSRTYTYTLRAERGTHEFDDVVLACRSLGGAHETERTEAVETTVTCRPEIAGTDTPPLRSLVARHGGQVPTDSGGSGVEFQGVREYRPGDRTNRIDWARRARTGELTTLEFREERRATVVLLVDARREGYVRAGAEASDVHGVEWSVRAAAGVFAGVADAGNPVGVAAVGSEFVWLAPGMGDVHRRRTRDVLGSHPALSPSPPRTQVREFRVTLPSPDVDRTVARQLHQLDVHLSENAQVFVLSPLADEAAVTIVRRLQTAGNPVTVLSPDVTRGTTAGGRLEALLRQRRIGTLRRHDVRVIDCRVDESLAVAFERAREVWL